MIGIKMVNALESKIILFPFFSPSLNKVILFWSPFPILWFQAIEPIRKWALKYSATRKRSVGIPLILETKTKKPNPYFPIDTGFTLLWLSPGLLGSDSQDDVVRVAGAVLFPPLPSWEFCLWLMRPKAKAQAPTPPLINTRMFGSREGKSWESVCDKVTRQ